MPVFVHVAICKCIVHIYALVPSEFFEILQRDIKFSVPS